MAAKLTRKKHVESFGLQPGRILARKYRVVSKIGEGWESEVYLIREINTGIERAAKLFFPQRNIRNKASKFYAQKLHKLRHCPILIQYFTEETITYRKQSVTALISEYVEGELLNEFLARQPRRRMQPFQAVHLLHALAVGIERIHQLQEYHGDLHAENIIVSRFGLGFDLKLIDLFKWNAPKKENMRDDICDIIRIFYDALGGAKYYAKQPAEVKAICCGLKRSLILNRFRTMSALREHLETMRWN